VKAPTAAFLGTLRSELVTEDTESFVYRPERRPARGVFELAAALAVGAGAFLLVTRMKAWYGWILGAPPLLVCAVLAARGLAWLWPRPMFTLTLDRRARTLLVSMPTDRGQGLAKTRFADVQAVDVAEKDASFAVSLPLHDGRRIGLGFFRRREDAEATAARFAGLIGVDVRR
jgi:hypothetical protein